MTCARGRLGAGKRSGSTGWKTLRTVLIVLHAVCLSVDAGLILPENQEPAKLSSSRPRSNPSKLELSVPEQDSSYSNLGCRTNSQSDLNADKDDGMNSRRPSSVQSSSRARSSKIEDENANWNFIINQGKIIGNGTFGVVYEAVLEETGEKVAVKRVRQDPRFRNRELAIMRLLNHPNIVPLKHYGFSSVAASPGKIYLNLVMEFLPANLHRLIKYHARRQESMSLLSAKVYSWQILRALAYLHRRNICHRDIKPQNVLIDPETHKAKLCDFGSSKRLQSGTTSIAYICSRFYRSPELIMGATEYSTSIDMWSFGCVLGEMLIGRPLFPAESQEQQLKSIAQVIGVPDGSMLKSMKVNMTEANMEKLHNKSVKVQGWEILRSTKTPLEAADLLSQLLVYKPEKRLNPLQCLAHSFFDVLRSPDTCLPGKRSLPSLFDFTTEEILWARELNLLHRIVPAHARGELNFQGTPVTSPNPTPLPSRGPSPG
mmetsp:Transcript_46658/g.146286  ORF Transcript_46658/g.146286 Transcript_46658/m.146286 type:complete len:487 (-) Transcript_46658:321-1781(-)